MAFDTPLKGMFSEAYQAEESEVFASRSEKAAEKAKEFAKDAEVSAQGAKLSLEQAKLRDAALNAEGGHALNDIAAMYAIPQNKLSLYPTSGTVVVGNYYLYTRDGLTEVWKALGTGLVDDPQNGNFELLPPTNRGGVLLTKELPQASSYGIDISAGSFQKLTLTAPITTITFTNVPTALGKTVEVNLIIKQGRGSGKITWPANIKWQNGREPTLSYKQDAEDVITLTWVNGDPIPYGFFVSGWMINV